MSVYLVQEDGSKLLLEDLSGAVLLEQQGEHWTGQLRLERGKVYADSWQMGERPNPSKLRW